ncbi:MAG: hypothetical protein AMXMBFR58_28220 [Phycisphaerae bacterium]
MNRRLGTVAFFSLLTSTAVARQACPGYWESINTLPGLDGSVTTSVMWDPDKSGPQSPQLVIGGTFSRVGTAYARSVALYNGTEFSPLGTNLLGCRFLFVWDEDLYAVTQQFGRLLHRWNGSSWLGVAPGPNFNITAVAQFEGNIVLGGWKEVHRWDGANWSGFGAGLNSYVYSLIEYKGQLVAGGHFTASGSTPVPYIAIWNSTQWETLGGGANSDVLSMAVLGDELCVAGSFTQIGGVAAPGFAAWNGVTWRALPSGPFYQSKLFAMHDTLYASTESAPGGFYRMEENGWTPVEGIGYVSHLREFEGTVMAAGGHSIHNRNLFLQNGEAWHRLIDGGINMPVPAMAASAWGLVVCNEGRTVHGMPASSLALHTGSDWIEFPADAPNGNLSAIVPVGESLYIWGSFTSIGDLPCAGNARYHDGAWESVSIPPPFYTDVQADGSVLVADHAGVYQLTQTTCNQISPPIPQYGLPVAATLWNEKLLVARPNEDPIGDWVGVLELVNGQWVPFGPFNTNVYGFVEQQGDLYALISTSDRTRKFLARWTGVEWEAVSEPVVNDYITDVRVIRGRIAAFGSFATLDGSTLNSPILWDDAEWSSLEPGLDVRDGSKLVEWGDRLVTFTDADPNSYGIAAWVRPFGPEINQQPAHANVCIRGTLDSSIDACGDGLQYGWLLNDVLLEDGVLPTGAVISGASTAWLHIDQITAAELGSLMCRVSNSHRTLDSDTVSISTCIADYDCTGFGDTDDFDSFVRSFEAGDQQADVDGSGFVDTDDFDFFVHAFEAGCP